MSGFVCSCESSTAEYCDHCVDQIRQTNLAEYTTVFETDSMSGFFMFSSKMFECGRCNQKQHALFSHPTHGNRFDPTQEEWNWNPLASADGDFCIYCCVDLAHVIKERVCGNCAYYGAGSCDHTEEKITATEKEENERVKENFVEFLQSKEQTL